MSMLTDRQMDEQADTLATIITFSTGTFIIWREKMFSKLFLLKVFLATKFLLKKYTSIYLCLPTIIRVNISNGCFYFLNNNEFTSQ